MTSLMRRYVATIALVLTGACASTGPAYTPPKIERMLWVSGKSGTIERFAMSADGHMDFVDEVNVGANPSFMSIDAMRRIAYIVDEEAGSVLAYKFDAQGAVSPFGPTAESPGGPTHIAARDGLLLTANYNAGRVYVFALAADGAIKPKPQQVIEPGKNAHQIVFDPTGRFVFVPCLGSDHIAQFAVEKGALRANGVVQTAANAGPRHLAFHPSRPFAFGLNELDSTMQSYALGDDGKLTAIGQPVALVPHDFSGTNSGAEVQVSRDGRFLYASNRGHDSIVQYAIDQSTGALTTLRFTPVGGERPRHFLIDASGRWLAAAHEGSSTLAIFMVDGRDGKLTQVSGKHVGDAPQFVDFVP